MGLLHALGGEKGDGVEFGKLRDVGKNLSFYSSTKSGIRDFRAERAKLKRCVIGVVDYRGR